MIHKEKCGSENYCTIRASSDSHFHWKKSLHKNIIYFMIYADFEADEIENSNLGS